MSENYKYANIYHNDRTPAKVSEHPPMRGWLVMPLIGADGLNYGFIQVSDRYEGDFSQEDEVNLGRLANLTSTALDALAQTYLPDYREKIASMTK